jgi:hypothetical protein
MIQMIQIKSKKQNKIRKIEGIRKKLQAEANLPLKWN